MHTSCRVCQGGLEQFNQSSKQMPFTSVIFVMRRACSMSLRSMRWSLSGTRSLRAGSRSCALRVQCGPVTSLRFGEKANGAMKAEMLGLSGCDCPQARGPFKWSEMHWNPGHQLL